MDSALTDPARIAALLATGLLDSEEDPALRRMARLATSMLHVPMAVISLVDSHRQVFHGATNTGSPWVVRETPLAHSFCQQAVLSQRELIIPDTHNDARYADNPSVVELRISAYCGVPLRLSNGLVLGAFCAIDHEPRLWQAEDVRLLHDLAASAVTELELRIALRENEQRRVLLDAVVGNVPDALIAINAADGALLLCNQAATQLFAEHAVAESASWQQLRSTLGLQHESGAKLSADDDPIARAVRNHDTVSNWWLPATSTAATARRCVSISARLIDDTCVLATFRDITETLQHTADLTALANRDGLTNVHNRRGFFARAETMLRNAAEHQPTTIFFVDVNAMKTINDEWGHSQGDLALQLVAATLTDCFRDSDIIGRIGGDEFAVMAYTVTADTAARLIERVHATLLRRSLEAQLPTSVAVTIGSITCYGRGDRSLAQLLAEADAQMYIRKKRLPRFASVQS